MGADIKVAAYLVRNPELYSELAAFGVPFGEKTVQGVWSILDKIWKKHKKFPPLGLLLDIIKRHPKLENKEDTRKILLAVASEIYAEESLCDTTREVILTRILDNYKYDLKGEVDSLDIDTIGEQTSELSQKILKIQSLLRGSDEGWVLPFSSEYINNPTQVLEEVLGPRVPIGLPKWSEWMAGGPRKQESMLVIGRSNDGKSLVNVSFGCDCLREGGRVLYISADSSRGDLLSKFYANISGVDIEGDKVEGEFDYRLKEAIKGDWQDRLLLRVWSRDTRNIDEVRRDIERARKHYGTIDLVLLENMECFLPSNTTRTKDDWLNQGGIAAQIDSMSKDNDCFIVASTQSRDLTRNDDVVDMDKASRAKAKSHPMTHVVGICRNQKDMVDSTARLYMAKSKRKRCNYFVPVLMDKARMRLLERGEPFFPDVSEGQGYDPTAPRKMKGKATDYRKPPAGRTYTNGTPSKKGIVPKPYDDT